MIIIIIILLLLFQERRNQKLQAQAIAQEKAQEKAQAIAQEKANQAQAHAQVVEKIAEAKALKHSQSAKVLAHHSSMMPSSSPHGNPSMLRRISQGSPPNPQVQLQNPSRDKSPFRAVSPSFRDSPSPPVPLNVTKVCEYCEREYEPDVYQVHVMACAARSGNDIDSKARKGPDKRWSEHLLSTIDSIQSSIDAKRAAARGGLSKY